LTLVFDLLTHKVGHFIYLPRRPIVPICTIVGLQDC